MNFLSTQLFSPELISIEAELLFQ